MTGSVARLGSHALDVVAAFGRITRFGAGVVAAFLRPPARLRRTATMRAGSR